MARFKPSRWRCLWSAFCLFGAAPVHALSQTTNAAFPVTAQVTDDCSFNSTAMVLISVWCSLNTPMLASSSGVQPADLPAERPRPPRSMAGQKQPFILCDIPESARLENDSFNQFRLNITGRSSGPAIYYSTYNVCF